MSTLVIFDLEATCWEKHENHTREDSEIIEIGAVRIDKETGEIVDTFQRFIKPQMYSTLSSFCKSLTSIKQEDVDNAKDFYDVMPEFTKWLGDDDEYIMSWGMYDKNQILREGTKKNYYLQDIEALLNHKHLNMKERFSYVFNVSQCGLSKALKFLKLGFEGTHHRGIDDAINMALIYKKTKDKIFGGRLESI